jgi:hypothetical protein
MHDDSRGYPTHYRDVKPDYMVDQQQQHRSIIRCVSMLFHTKVQDHHHILLAMHHPSQIKSHILHLLL